jgi:hypothetical protein
LAEPVAAKDRPELENQLTRMVGDRTTAVRVAGAMLRPPTQEEMEHVGQAMQGLALRLSEFLSRFRPSDEA